MKKIKIAFRTGEIIRFIGCEVRYIDDIIEIECGRYTFRYSLNDIQYFYIKGGNYEKKVEA